MNALLLAALMLGLLTGCGKSPAPSAPATAERTAGEASPAAPPPAATAEPAKAAPTDGAQLASLLSDLTQAVRKYAAEQRQVPKTLEEIAAKGYLNGVPAAPPGKKFLITQRLEVSLADQ